MTSKDGGSITMTAGNAQIQIRGKTGDIKLGPHIVQELVKFEVEKEVAKLMTQLTSLSKTMQYSEVTTA
jgi:hypothetical protein